MGDYDQVAKHIKIRKINLGSNKGLQSSVSLKALRCKLVSFIERTGLPLTSFLIIPLFL